MKCHTGNHTDMTKYIFKRNRSASKYAFELSCVSSSTITTAFRIPARGLEFWFPRSLPARRSNVVSGTAKRAVPVKSIDEFHVSTGSTI
jgi:hypothetical protein